MKKRLYRSNTAYTPKLLDILDKFGLGPRIELSGFERDVLDVISQIDDAGFYDMCECFDMKPSRMEDRLLELENIGLVDYMDAAGKVKLTPLAEKLILSDDKDSRSEKKFRRFIESLTEEELDRFAELADAFEIDEKLYAEDDEEAEEDDDHFIIVDKTEAELDEEEEAAKAAEAAAEADSYTEDITIESDDAAESDGSNAEAEADTASSTDSTASGYTADAPEISREAAANYESVRKACGIRDDDPEDTHDDDKAF